jgi:putative transposase
LVDSDEYVLACYRYIELNPVRAAMVMQPGEYRWSSYACNAQGRHDARITPHAAYRSLGPTEDDRQAAHAALVASGIDIEQAHDLAVHTHQQKPWGSELFRRQIEALTGRAVEVKPRGRPAKAAGSATQGK